MGIYRAKIFFLALIFASFFISSCENRQIFQSANGENFDISYQGLKKILKINKSDKDFALVFFTPNCTVCIEQIPVLEALKNDFDFYVILSKINGKNEARDWVKEKNLNLPLFFEPKAAEFFDELVGGIFGVPIIVFFKNGQMNEKFLGLTPASILKAKVKALKEI